MSIPGRKILRLVLRNLLQEILRTELRDVLARRIVPRVVRTEGPRAGGLARAAVFAGAGILPAPTDDGNPPESWKRRVVRWHHLHSAAGVEEVPAEVPPSVKAPEGILKKEKVIPLSRSHATPPGTGWDRDRD
eukprot:836324-Prorocentrum_minimum.AAC.2